MKLKRSTLIPAILLVYLGVMACIGYPEYAAGKTSAAYYFGIIAVTIVIIVLLHFNIKHRERLRRERLDDMRRQDEAEKGAKQ